jgi:hypothetical protein
MKTIFRTLAMITLLILATAQFSGPTIPPGPWDEPDCDSHGCTDTW